MFCNNLLILFSLDLLLLGLDLFLFTDGLSTGLRHDRLDDLILSCLGFEFHGGDVVSGGTDFTFDSRNLCHGAFSFNCSGLDEAKG